MANYIADSVLATPTGTIVDPDATNINVLKVVSVVRYGAVHLTLPAPVRQWDGESWTYLYTPRM